MVPTQDDDTDKMIKSPQTAFRTMDMQDRQRALILFSWLLFSGWVCAPSSPANRKGIQMCGNQVIKQKWKRQTVESPVFCFPYYDLKRQITFQTNNTVWNLCSVRYTVYLGPLSRPRCCWWSWWMLSVLRRTLPTSLWEHFSFKGYGLGHMICFV